MKLLDDYFALQRQIFDYFGYVEDWCVIPLDDCRRFFWHLDGEGPGEVRYALTEGELRSGDEDCYSSDVYTQRFLPRWVYRGAEYTMICTDPHTDGNKFLSVFDNSKEVKDL